MPPQECSQEQTNVRADGGGEKSVDVRQHRGLLRDCGRKQLVAARRGDAQRRSNAWRQRLR